MEEHSTGGIGYLAGEWPLDLQKPTIVFIHGAGGSSLFWHNQIKGLSARVNTVAIDLTGHGRSPGAGKNAIADYAEVVVKFITETGVQYPILCGLSLGGAIVQQVLLNQPNLLKAGILFGTGASMKVAPTFLNPSIRTTMVLSIGCAKFAYLKKRIPRKFVPSGRICFDADRRSCPVIFAPVIDSMLAIKSMQSRNLSWW